MSAPKLKARKVARWEASVYADDTERFMTRLSMTESQYRRVNSMPNDKRFFLSRFYALNGECWVVKRNGKLYRQPFPCEIKGRLEEIPPKGGVQ